MWGDSVAAHEENGAAATVWLDSFGNSLPIPFGDGVSAHCGSRRWWGLRVCARDCGFAPISVEERGRVGGEGGGKEGERRSGSMSDDDHHFESKADAGASKTFPQQAGTIRKNAYLVIKTRPCKVRPSCVSILCLEKMTSSSCFSLGVMLRDVFHFLASSSFGRLSCLAGCGGVYFQDRKAWPCEVSFCGN